MILGRGPPACESPKSFCFPERRRDCASAQTPGSDCEQKEHNQSRPKLIRTTEATARDKAWSCERSLRRSSCPPVVFANRRNRVIILKRKRDQIKPGKSQTVIPVGRLSVIETQ